MARKHIDIIIEAEIPIIDSFIMEDIFQDIRNMIQKQKEWWNKASDEEKALARENAKLVTFGFE